MFIEIIYPTLLYLQGGAGVIENAYKLLQEGGLLMGSLLVIYGQNRFYRYMIEKLEAKHNGQVAYLEGELQKLSQAFLAKSSQDTETIREMTREMGRRSSDK